MPTVRPGRQPEKIMLCLPSCAAEPSSVYDSVSLCPSIVLEDEWFDGSISYPSQNQAKCSFDRDEVLIAAKRQLERMTRFRRAREKSQCELQG